MDAVENRSIFQTVKAKSTVKAKKAAWIQQLKKDNAAAAAAKAAASVA